MAPSTCVVVDRSALVTVAVPVGTEAAAGAGAAGWARHHQPAAPPATATAPTATQVTTARLVMSQLPERRHADLLVVLLRAGLDRAAEDRVGLAAGRHLVGGQPEAVPGREVRVAGRILDVRHAVGAQAL